MTEIKLKIPESLYEKMKKHPEIKWDSIAQSALVKESKLLEKLH